MSAPLGVTAWIGAVRAGELEPGAGVAELIEQIRSDDPRINSFVALRPRAIEEAEAVRGPLAGVPVAVKDMFVDEGRLPTVGSNVHAYWLGGTATIIRRLRAAGAVVIGYTNLHEWGISMTSLVTATGPIANPHAPSLIAGGSSGGSAAALAAGFVPAAVGTDAGGSIRVPAACCGVVGFKPTWGHVPLDGFASVGSGVDHAGPMSRSVNDVRVLAEVLMDRIMRRSTTSQLRVGIARDYFLDDVHPDVERVVSETAERMIGMVSDVRDVSLELGNARRALSRIVLPHLARLLARDMRYRSEDFAPETRVLLEMGAAMSTRSRQEAERTREEVSAAWDKVFSQVDIVMTPTLPSFPPSRDDPRVELPSGAVGADVAFLKLTAPMNLGGVPALSLPCGAGDNGHPISLTLTGAAGRDDAVLSFGEALEEVLPSA